MPGMPSTRAVFFDFGGTLYSYLNPGLNMRHVLREAADRLALSATRDELKLAYLTATRRAYLEFAPKPYYLHKELFVDTFRRFCKALGGRPEDDLLQWCYEAQRQIVIDNFSLRDDCLDTLTQLRDLGLHVGIVSNIDVDYLNPMLARAGLGALLHAWTSSEEARSCKPDARIFHCALSKADVKPEQALFVGDSLDADIAGAHALGMTTVHVNERGNSSLGASFAKHTPDHVVERLSDIVGISQA